MLLEISPDPIDLGILKQSESTAAKIALYNPGQQSVVVEQIETSCLCLDVGKPPIEIGPGESTALTVTFRPDNPDFRGGLSIEVIGRGVGGGIVFSTHVNVEVTGAPGIHPASENAAGQEPMDLSTVEGEATP